MKQVTRCANCQQIVKKLGSFNAMLEEEEIIGGVKTGKEVKKKVNLCRPCAKKAGYKVK